MTDLEAKIHEILAQMRFLEQFYNMDFITLEEYYIVKNRMIQAIINISQTSIKEVEEYIKDYNMN